MTRNYLVEVIISYHIIILYYGLPLRRTGTCCNTTKHTQKRAKAHCWLCHCYLIVIFLPYAFNNFSFFFSVFFPLLFFKQRKAFLCITKWRHYYFIIIIVSFIWRSVVVMSQSSFDESALWEWKLSSSASRFFFVGWVVLFVYNAEKWNLYESHAQSWNWKIW